MAPFRLEPLEQAAILDAPEWRSLCKERPPECLPEWLRFCCSPESGFELTHAVASLQADDGALAVAVVGDDGPLAPGDPPLRLRVGEPTLEAAWSRYVETRGDARGFESWIPRSISHGFLRTPGAAGDRTVVALVEELLSHARSQGYSYFLVRYVEHDDGLLTAALRERGARENETRPGTRLQLTGTSREDWLKSRPSRHRRDISRSWQRFADGGGTLVTVPVPGEWAARCQELHELTCARFSTRPFLSGAFFRMRPGTVNGEFHLFFQRGRLDGFAFCLHGTELYSARVAGVDPEAPDLWGVVYQACVEGGIARGARTVTMGLTGYDGKRALGATMFSMSNFFFVLDPALQKVL